MFEEQTKSPRHVVWVTILALVADGFAIALGYAFLKAECQLNGTGVASILCFACGPGRRVVIQPEKVIGPLDDRPLLRSEIEIATEPDFARLGKASIISCQRCLV